MSPLLRRCMFFSVARMSSGCETWRTLNCSSSSRVAEHVAETTVDVDEAAVEIHVTDTDGRELDHVRVSLFAFAQAIERQGARVEAADLGAERPDEPEQLPIGLRHAFGEELDHANRATV